jgi:hypothetical protein
MIACDVLRIGTVGLMAIPGMPFPALCALLFCTVLAGAPFSSVRAALLPDVLPGDKFVLGSRLGRRFVRYIRFYCRGRSETAAVAEARGGAALPVGGVSRRDPDRPQHGRLLTPLLFGWLASTSSRRGSRRRTRIRCTATR